VRACECEDKAQWQGTRRGGGDKISGDCAYVRSDIRMSAFGRIRDILESLSNHLSFVS
jgi:hypothetical protein